MKGNVSNPVALSFIEVANTATITVTDDGWDDWDISAIVPVSARLVFFKALTGGAVEVGIRTKGSSVDTGQVCQNSVTLVGKSNSAGLVQTWRNGINYTIVIMGYLE